MYTRKLGRHVVLTIVLGASAAFAQAPNLGKPLNPAEIAEWDINAVSYTHLTLPTIYSV